MATSILQSAVFLLLPAGILWLARLIFNHRTLSSIPGPFLASLSDFWRAFYQYNGKLRSKLLGLHQQYGPVVRYGVNAVSINDPAVINTIYASRARFATADSYKVLTGISNGKEIYSLISSPESAHGAMRRAAANAFTPTAVLDYEQYLDQTIPELLELIESEKKFDLATILLYYSIDAAGRFAFSEPLGCLQSRSDPSGMIDAVRGRFNHWGWWFCLPKLEHALFKNKIMLYMSKGGGPSGMANIAGSKLRNRMTVPDHKQVDILQRFIEASKVHTEVLTPVGITGLVMSTISGAGDTTATTVTSVFYYLFHNPKTEQKLRQELVEAALPAVPSYAAVKDLPYLDSVIKEAMRLFPIINIPLERTVPAGGVTMAGKHFPEGTIVGVLPSVLHRNTSVYGEDVEVFRPERWIETDAEQRRLMDATFMGFSRGKRVCMGQHIAIMNVKKVITALLGKFKLSLVDPYAPLDAEFHPAVVAMKQMRVNVDEVLR